MWSFTASFSILDFILTYQIGGGTPAGTGGGSTTGPTIYITLVLKTYSVEVGGSTDIEVSLKWRNVPSVIVTSIVPFGSQASWVKTSKDLPFTAYTIIGGEQEASFPLKR